MTIIAPILHVSRGLLNNSAPSLLRLIPYRMRQRPFVLDHLTEITAIDPATTGRTPDEMLRFVLRRIANALAEVFAPRNHLSQKCCVKTLQGDLTAALGVGPVWLAVLGALNPARTP